MFLFSFILHTLLTNFPPISYNGTTSSQLFILFFLFSNEFLTYSQISLITFFLTTSMLFFSKNFSLHMHFQLSSLLSLSLPLPYQFHLLLPLTLSSPPCFGLEKSVFSKNSNTTHTSSFHTATKI